jgi:hypothetical protein
MISDCSLVKVLFFEKMVKSEAICISSKEKTCIITLILTHAERWEYLQSIYMMSIFVYHFRSEKVTFLFVAIGLQEEIWISLSNF